MKQYKIVVFTLKGQYKELRIYGYESKFDAYDELDGYISGLSYLTNTRCDGAVYEMTADETFVSDSQCD